MNSMNSNNAGNRPERKFVAGSVSASVWVNRGAEREFRTVSLQRSYKDRDGSWKVSQSLSANDVPRALLVLQQAFEYLVLRDVETDTEAVI